MRLTQRQRDIAELASQGLTNKQISDRLHLSVHSVERHVSAIFRVLGLKHRVALASYWLTGGREKHLEKPQATKALTRMQTLILSLLVETPGLATAHLARYLSLNIKTTYGYIRELEKRGIVFEHRDRGCEREWFPSVVGLALHKARRDFQVRLERVEGRLLG